MSPSPARSGMCALLIMLDQSVPERTARSALATAWPHLDHALDTFVHDGLGAT